MKKVAFGRMKKSTEQNMNCFLICTLLTPNPPIFLLFIVASVAMLNVKNKRT
jgi:hypothetical protein